MPELFSQLGQYGPFALFAGILLFINWKHQQQMAKRLATLENQMMTTIKNNTEAMTLLTQTLNGKPCILNKEQ